MNVRRKICIPLIALSSMVLFAISPSLAQQKSSPDGRIRSELQSQQMPKTILIIRHAEKPPAATGSPDLAEKGMERAKVIPSLFLSPTSTGTARFERPEALFATRATQKSNRPIETILPLSKALHLPIDERYGRGDLTALVQELASGKYAGKVVLISWHHAEMQALAHDLGATDVPAWPETLFDRIWKIEWIDGKAQLTSLPQMLLPGDAAQ